MFTDHFGSCPTKVSLNFFEWYSAKSHVCFPSTSSWTKHKLDVHFTSGGCHLFMDNIEVDLLKNGFLWFVSATGCKIYDNPIVYAAIKSMLCPTPPSTGMVGMQ